MNRVEPAHVPGCFKMFTKKQDNLGQELQFILNNKEGLC